MLIGFAADDAISNGLALEARIFEAFGVAKKLVFSSGMRVSVNGSLQNVASSVSTVSRKQSGLECSGFV
jgi:hypothetical protein